MPPAQRIGLFGGTFDPIHLGHTEMASAALDAMQLDQVRFIPCQISPHKDIPPTEPLHRVKMAQLATANLPWAVVDKIETTQTGPSYSWKTAESLQQQFPEASLFWILGTDQWNALPRWAEPDRLAASVEFIVFTRGETPRAHPNFTCKTIQFEHPASATEIRHDLAAKKQSAWLHPDVAKYIADNELYVS